MTQMKRRTPKANITPAPQEDVGAPASARAPEVPLQKVQEEPLVTLSTRITAENRDNIKRMSYETGQSKQAIVNAALEQYLRK